MVLYVIRCKYWTDFFQFTKIRVETDLEQSVDFREIFQKKKSSKIRIFKFSWIFFEYFNKGKKRACVITSGIAIQPICLTTLEALPTKHVTIKGQSSL